MRDAVYTVVQKKQFKSIHYIYSTTQHTGMFKSLADSSTWNTEEEKQTEKNTSTVSDTVDCELEEEYDIPKNRESLNALVKNLSFIVAKLKEQIQKLDETASTPSGAPSREDIDAASTTSSTKTE